LLIGMTLVADGAGFAIPRGNIYAGIGFIVVEAINQLATRRRTGKGRGRGARRPSFVNTRRDSWEEASMLRTSRRHRSTR
jgi:hypothetical protein